MITKPTVLVLGAGASIPYGFPSGLELVEKISEFSRSASEDEGFEDLKEPLRALHLGLSVSRTPSIDYFLSQNPSLKEIGKQAIHYIISSRESNLINVRGNAYLFQNLDEGGDWYGYLWRRLIDGVSNWRDLLHNNLSIVTFNYNTSLENYLYSAFLAMYEGTTDEDATAFINSLNIRHVFGSTGGCSWIDGRAYGSSSFKQSVKGAESLFTIHESMKEKGHIAEITSALASTPRIVVLGFGYHTENMEIIQLNSTFRTDCENYYCAFGMTEAEKRNVMSRLNKSEHAWPFDYTANAHSALPSLTFLRNTGALY